MRKFLIILIVMFLSSCFIEQKKDVVGVWNYSKKNEADVIYSEKISINADKTFSWKKYTVDSNGETILEEISGTYTLDVKFTNDSKAYPTILFNYNETKSVKFLYKILADGETLFLTLLDDGTIYTRVEEEV